MTTFSYLKGWKGIFTYGLKNYNKTNKLITALQKSQTSDHYLHTQEYYTGLIMHLAIKDNLPLKYIPIKEIIGCLDAGNLEAAATVFSKPEIQEKAIGLIQYFLTLIQDNPAIFPENAQQELQKIYKVFNILSTFNLLKALNDNVLIENEGNDLMLDSLLKLTVQTLHNPKKLNMEDLLQKIITQIMQEQDIAEQTTGNGQEEGVDVKTIDNIIVSVMEPYGRQYVEQKEAINIALNSIHFIIQSFEKTKQEHKPLNNSFDLIKEFAKVIPFKELKLDPKIGKFKYDIQLSEGNPSISCSFKFSDETTLGKILNEVGQITKGQLHIGIDDFIHNTPLDAEFGLEQNGKIYSDIELRGVVGAAVSSSIKAIDDFFPTPSDHIIS